MTWAKIYAICCCFTPETFAFMNKDKFMQKAQLAQTAKSKNRPSHAFGKFVKVGSETNVWQFSAKVAAAAAEAAADSGDYSG